jgi:hypothetical protein
MSEKDRLKKDHERTNKKNKAMRAQENAQVQTASPKHQAKDESNLTGTQPGPSR